MSTDEPDPSDLPPAVREALDSLGGALGDIAELDKEQLNETIGLLETLGHDQAAGILRSRREVLKGAGAATGLGIAGLAGATATGGARAQPDTQTGTIGNGNQDADLQDVSAESVSTDDAQVNNPPAADAGVARLADVAIRPNDTLTIYRNTQFTVSGDTVQTIFDVTSPVTITHGMIVGPSVGEVTVTFDDSTTKQLYLDRTRGDTTTGSSVGAKMLPLIANATKLTFENRDGSDRAYGWEVATREL